MNSEAIANSIVRLQASIGDYTLGFGGLPAAPQAEMLVEVLCTRISHGDKSASTELYRMLQGLCFAGMLKPKALEKLDAEIEALIACCLPVQI